MADKLGNDSFSDKTDGKCENDSVLLTNQMDVLYISVFVYKILFHKMANIAIMKPWNVLLRAHSFLQL